MSLREIHDRHCDSPRQQRALLSAIGEALGQIQ
jgi:hypothetical protein